MPFELDIFVERYPFCVHRTHLDNRSLIKKHLELWPPSELYRSAELQSPKSRRVSSNDLRLHCYLGTVRLNDQDPFLEQHGRFVGGWDANRFRRELDSRVFLWPLRSACANGAAHAVDSLALGFLKKYAATSLLLVMPTRDLFDANSDLVPEFSHCNSGTLAARTRKHNVRGPDTFQPAGCFPRTLSQVREVTFRGRVRLPDSMRLIRATAFMQ